jgi:hypothetical protein
MSPENREQRIETETAHVKYVFVDVVRFSVGRNVESQSEIVRILNGIVRSAVSSANVSSDQIIFIPTGDGICTALVNTLSPYAAKIGIAGDGATARRAVVSNTKHTNSRRLIKNEPSAWEPIPGSWWARQDLNL